jgi:hypothetical protein
MTGNDEDSPVNVQDVDMMTVELPENVGSDHLVGGAARRAPSGQVDDSIHDRQERIHLMCREEHRDVLFLGDAIEKRDDLLATSDIEVGEWLVEKEQLGPADQRMGDEDPLLLASRQLADPSIREPLGVYGVEHLID